MTTITVTPGNPSNNAIINDGTILDIQNGGVATSATINSGGLAYVENGGSAVATTVDAGGLEVVSAGGVDRGAMLISGVQYVSAGAVASGAVVNGGAQDVGASSDGSVSFAGGSSVSAVAMNNGLIALASGGVAQSATLLSGGLAYVSAGGVADATRVTSAGALYVSSGGTASATTVSDGGVEYVFSKGVADDSVVTGGGLENVFGGGTANGLTLDGGSATVVAGGIAANATIGAGGTLDLGDGGGATGGIDFSTAGGALAIDDMTMPTVTIAGFAAGDAIDLNALTYSAGDSVAFSGNRATVSAGGMSYSFTFAAGTPTNFRVGAGASGEVQLTEVTLACFLAGTRIRVARGAVPVERLAVGDTVLTVSGVLRPVVWAGRRTVDCRRHPAPASVRPFLVAAGAFGEGKPVRDLFLSPDHAVFVGGVLIPIGRLANGTTVRQVAVARATYHHVELDRHDAVLAENLPCESFLDTDDRRTFEGAEAERLFPDFSGADRVSRAWEAAGFAPLVIVGATLDRVRRQLDRRAKVLGQTVPAGSRRKAG